MVINDVEFQVFMFCIHHYRKHRRKEQCTRHERHEALLLRTPGVERRAAHEALLLNPGWWSASATMHFCYLQGSRRKNCTMCSSNPHSSNSRVAINSHSKRQSTNQPIDRSTNSNNQPKLKMLLRDLVSTLVGLPTSPGRMHFRMKVQHGRSARSTSISWMN
jgi:hypothetical protein